MSEKRERETDGVKRRKSQVSLWKDVSVRDLEKLECTRSSGDLRRALPEVLSVKSSCCEPRASALLDLYYYTLLFCWDSGFSGVQTSCVISMVKELHAACVGSALGDIAECDWQQLLLAHAVHRPPFSALVFSAQQLLHIQDYIMMTFCRHYKLYKYVFTPEATLDLSIIYKETSEREAGDKTDVHAEDRPDDITREMSATDAEHGT